MFQTMTLEDLTWIKPLILGSDLYSTEVSPFDCYGWSDFYGTQVAQIEGFFVSRFCMADKGWVYNCPIGLGNPRPAIDKLLTLEQFDGNAHLYILFNHKQQSLLEAACGDLPREIERLRRSDDYIYNANDLITLAGSKYHAKRNLIAQFERKYDWRFAPLSSCNDLDWQTVLAAWGEQSHESIDPERHVIELLLRDMSAFNGIGGLLYADGRPMAFSLGTCLNPKVLVVHIEKALTDYVGAYAMIMHEFTRYAHSQYPFSFVNREEDLGSENLRKSKMALHPAFMEEKSLWMIPLEIDA